MTSVTTMLHFDNEEQPAPVSVKTNLSHGLLTSHYVSLDFRLGDNFIHLFVNKTTTARALSKAMHEAANALHTHSHKLAGD